MRFFELHNMLDLVLYLFPAFVSVLLIGLALSFSSFRTGGSPEKDKGAHHVYPEDIVDGKGPFPVVLILIIAGTLLWAFFYILMTGLLEVAI